MINKVVESFDEAVKDIPSGATIHVGGMQHFPSNLIAAIARKGIRDLTIISCVLSQNGPSSPRGASDQGVRDLDRERVDGAGPVTVARPVVVAEEFVLNPALLAELGLIRKGVTGFVSAMRGEALPPFEQLIARGLAEAELNSQGVLAERIRAAKAGIAAFYTTTGVGTPPAAHKEVKYFDGVPHVLETALKADFAIVRASAADRWGNLVYDRPPSFNHVMAGAATVTIAEVDDIVPLGELRPEHIKTAGVFVDRVVKVPAISPTSWMEAH